MYNWRFMLLAFLAALHPIASFTKRNTVDGRGQCCDNEPPSLLRETRLSYESHRLWKITPKDNRLNLNRDICENQRYEVDYSVVRRSTRDRGLAKRCSETEKRRVAYETSRFARDNIRRGEPREGDRRLRELKSVERKVHRITSRDISRLERDRVRDSRKIFSRENNVRNKISVESRHESRNRDARTEFRIQEKSPTHNLLQRARDDVVSSDRRVQQIRRDSNRNPGHRINRSLERRDHQASDRMETFHEQNRNEFRLNRERDSTHRMSPSHERRNQRSSDKMETHHELNQNELRLNRERKPTTDPTLKMGRLLERRDYRLRDISEARDEIRRSVLTLNRELTSQDSERRVYWGRMNERHLRDVKPESDQSDRRILREKRPNERVPSVSRSQSDTRVELNNLKRQTRDFKEHSQATEWLYEERVFSSRQGTRNLVESRSNRLTMGDKGRGTTRGMTNDRVLISRSESRQMDRRVSGQNGRRMYEKDMKERYFRSRSLSLDGYRERQSSELRERKRASADRVRDEGRVPRINDRRMDRRQMDSNTVELVRDDWRESRNNVRGVRKSLGEDRRISADRLQRERDSFYRVRAERESQFNVQGVQSSLNENRRQRVDRRQRDRNTGDLVRDERRESRNNDRGVRSSRSDDLSLSADQLQRERNSVGRTRVERESRINARGVQSSLDENRRLSVDRRQREREAKERSESRVNVREVRSSLGESVDRSERDSVARVSNERRETQLSKNLKVRDEDERQNYRRKSVIRNVQNSEQRLTETSRIMRIKHVRHESLIPRESLDRARNFRLERREIRQSIRNHDTESRSYNQRERATSESRQESTRLVNKLKSVERQVSRDSSRDESINRNIANRITRNMQRDNYPFRSNVRFENRDLRYKTQGTENIFTTMKWQYLFYTLQAIYLCGIFAKIMSKEATGKKTRSLQWWTGSSHNFMKVD